ncbi:MAG TPA: SIMPL domain-containing protein [Hydrogenophaga sp.]
MAINPFQQENQGEQARMPQSRRMTLRAVVLAFALAGPVALAHADAINVAPAVQPANLVSLSASGFLEVPQDWLTVRLSVSREGNDAASVQSQLRKALDSGMAVARAAVAPNQQLQARSGAFGVYPSYDKNGKISGWQGKADLVLEGRDFTKIANTAGKIDTMAISGMGFSLSRETQQKLESDVQALAIERFQARAKDVAKGFGFDSFQLREVNVSSADDGGGMPMPVRAMAMEAKSMSSSPRVVAMEPGMSRVTVNVSGTVALK